MARNRVLEAALEHGADWLAFMDDDQTAHPDWIEKLLFVARRDGADGVSSRKTHVVPEPLPFWYAANPDRKPAAAAAAAASVEAADGPVEGRRRKELPTNGVLISARLIRGDGLGLRFNERLALGGLEDGEFFTNASSRGALLVGSCLPKVTEEMHRSRMTYRRYVLRGLAQGGAIVARYKLSNGTGRAAVRYTVASLVRGLRGLGMLLISPLFLLGAMQRFKFTALEGGRNLLVAAGMLGGIFSLQYEYYREVDGY
jgi:glycosyltransferase involved in cell wall biosynthesis